VYQSSHSFSLLLLTSDAIELLSKGGLFLAQVAEVGLITEGVGRSLPIVVRRRGHGQEGIGGTQPESNSKRMLQHFFTS